MELLNKEEGDTFLPAYSTRVTMGQSNPCSSGRLTNGDFFRFFFVNCIAFINYGNAVYKNGVYKWNLRLHIQQRQEFLSFRDQDITRSYSVGSSLRICYLIDHKRRLILDDNKRKPMTCGTQTKPMSPFETDGTDISLEKMIIKLRLDLILQRVRR